MTPTPSISSVDYVTLICPECKASGDLVERGRRGWCYCCVCSLQWLLDEQGALIRKLYP